jgi:hypothetical protein
VKWVLCSDSSTRLVRQRKRRAKSGQMKTANEKLPKSMAYIDRAIQSAMSKITCVRCNERTVYVTPKGKVGRLCGPCFLVAFSELPNPDCENCLGMGQYLAHSNDCNDDLCVLAGGYHDCRGNLQECDCSILD